MAEDTENKSTEKTEIPERTIERQKADGYVQCYSNNVELGTTPWDIRVRFGEVTGVTTEKLIIIDRATIVMSPQHAKAFSIILRRNVQKWEEANGTISLPQELTEEEEVAESV